MERNTNLWRIVGGVALAAAGAAAGAFHWRRNRQHQAIFEHLDSISDPVDNAADIVDALIEGLVPHKVLEAYRFADGDAFILAVGSRSGEVYYLLALGMPPVGEAPDFEESWLALLQAEAHANETGDRRSAETCLNVRYAAFEIPEDRGSRMFVRRMLEGLAESHGEEVEAYRSSDPDGFLNSLGEDWLFASPVRLAQSRLDELT